MWTPTTRQQHSRIVTRYQTDLTDEEWRVIAPPLPKPCVKGRPRAWPMREMINGIFYVMRAGCPWRLLPNDLPPWGTIYRWFAAWRDDGRFERINHALVMAHRERVGGVEGPLCARNGRSISTPHFNISIIGAFPRSQLGNLSRLVSIGRVRMRLAV